MTTSGPLVSVLITTYNRSRLLRRAINSVLMQDFRDFEIVIIDDCSPDDTTDVVASYEDPRIRYLRNETNVGSQVGDRAILRRFVYELMRGKYWVYLCDDDYWLFPDLLRRQVEAFETHDDVVMVMGGQLSYFLTTPDSYFGYPPDNPITFTLENIDEYFDRATLKPKIHHVYFMRGQGLKEPLFSKECLTAEEFLAEFASDPAGKNIIGGAMLYSREFFIKSGALSTPKGSQWQAGYELKLGPACFGKTIYFDEPSIVTEVRQGNASFQRTQVEHYLDSIVSIEIAFKVPLAHPELAHRRKFLRHARNETIRNLSRTYLINSLSILRDGRLGLCTADNVRVPVMPRHVLRAFLHNGALPNRDIWFYAGLVMLESATGGQLLRTWMENKKQRESRGWPINNAVLLLGTIRGEASRLIRSPFYSIWGRMPESLRAKIRPIFRPR